ncbi:nuclear transport factor 2 family protein [Mycobacterium sp.]|uniref:nuclear transport factor 2 family protein n=1 Tax=Mycobacterium sp. TaxID=1785 RepID=UPI003BB1278D
MAVASDSPGLSAEDQTRSVVQQFYDYSLRADIEGVAKILHPDIVNYEAASLPYGGTHTGRAEVLQLLAQLYSMIDLDTVAVGDILANSERAAAFLEVPFGDSASSETVSVIETFVIRDGLIAEIKPYYFDTAALAAR